MQTFWVYENTKVINSGDIGEEENNSVNTSLRG